MLRTPLRALLVALVLALALPSLAAAAVEVAAKPGQATITGTEALAPGATRIDFRGTGRETDLQLFRLNEGQTVEAFTAAAARTRNPTRLQQFGSFEGGAAVSRGRVYGLDLELVVGTYVVLDITRRPKSVGTFTVAGTPTGVVLPEGDVTIGLRDFRISVGGTLPKNGAISVVNNGPSPHFVIAFPVRSARAIRAARHALEHGEDRALGRLIAGQPITLVNLLSPGSTNVVHAKLKRGAWVLACFYADPRSRNTPHAFHGMTIGAKVK